MGGLCSPALNAPAWGGGSGNGAGTVEPAAPVLARKAADGAPPDWGFAPRAGRCSPPQGVRLGRRCSGSAQKLRGHGCLAVRGAA
jgi:hypothetical protein